jgi:hypothetical protein
MRRAKWVCLLAKKYGRPADGDEWEKKAAINRMAVLRVDLQASWRRKEHVDEWMAGWEWALLGVSRRLRPRPRDS